MRIEVRGTEEFDRVARKLRGMPKDLRRETFKALNSTTKDSRNEIVAQLANFLPDNYAADLAGDLSVRATGRFGKSPSVRIRTKGRKKKRRLGALERGQLRHLTWGRRPWHLQAVEPGFHSIPLEEDAPETRRALVEALQAIAAKIAD